MQILPKYIAVNKQGLNFTILYETTRVDTHDGKVVYSLRPVATSEYAINDVAATSNEFNSNMFVRRTVKIDNSQTNHHDYPISMVSSDLSYVVKILSTNVVSHAPCVRVGRGNVNRVLGNRYTSNMSSYFFSWDPTNEQKSAIRTYIGDHIDTLTVFTLQERVSVPITSIERIDAPVVAPPVVTSVPRHVLDGFLESVIRRGEVCPISMEPIAIDDCCVTPCFHVISYDSAATWIRMHNSCPVCRTACDVSHLHRPSA
jgi:hypothetical protein